MNKVGLDEVVHFRLVERCWAYFKEILKALSLTKTIEIENERSSLRSYILGYLVSGRYKVCLESTKIWLNMMWGWLEANGWIKAILRNFNIPESGTKIRAILCEEYLAFWYQKTTTYHVFLLESLSKVLTLLLSIRFFRIMKLFAISSKAVGAFLVAQDLSSLLVSRAKAY